MLIEEGMKNGKYVILLWFGEGLQATVERKWYTSCGSCALSL